MSVPHGGLAATNHSGSGTDSTVRSVLPSLPSLFLTNANHVMNKLEELTVILPQLGADIIAITETWLSDDIPDSACSIQGYNLVRRDRPNQLGGGVLFYVSCSIDFRIIDLPSAVPFNFEVLWISVRPRLLPRPLSVLVYAVVYCPPCYNAESRAELNKYIVEGVDQVSRKYLHAGIFIVGDFNSLETDNFNRFLHLKQIVSRNTRGHSILDKIFTNCAKYFLDPIFLAPLGKSDHNCVLLNPSVPMQHPVGYRNTTYRHLTDIIVERIISDLYAINWQYMYRLESCQLQADFFFGVLYDVINLHAPVRVTRVKNNDKPWITAQFKALISERNEAFSNNDRVRYKMLRNKTNRLRRVLKQRFYLKHVELCKKGNPHEWWKAVKKICGVADGQESSLSNMTFLNEIVDNSCLANVINDFFVAVAKDVPVINSDELSALRAQLPIVPDCFVVSEMSVFYALKHLNVNKSAVSDLFDNRFLISAAEVLAGPICAIVNSSIRQGVVPHQWKISRVTPIPKSLPPRSIESDLRPISITSSISKVAESLVSRLFNQHFNPLSDCNQFGCSKDRSTTHALIKICHVIFEGSDLPCNFTRVFFIDFTKAFDLINHNILHKKLVEYKFPPHLITWSLSFLEKRLQYVRIGSQVSDIRELNAGVPQGTVAGPNDFKVLINDLHFDLPYIKYVDDTTVASVSPDPMNSALQDAANYLVNWCNINGMLINTKKQKKCYFILDELYLRMKSLHFTYITLILSVCNHSNCLVYISVPISAGLLMWLFC